MEPTDYLRVLFGLVTVLGLIGTAGFIARKGNLLSIAPRLARKRRLQIVESLAIDARRRAIILRKDGREHLVVLGPQGETLVDSAPALVDAETEAAPAAAGETPAPVNPFKTLFAQVGRERPAA
ncbi:MAG: flagellar biosynthetic protein FliO [Pseudomonadota bacterium]